MSSGSAALNDVLARNRALAVRDYLRALHLPEATTIRLTAKGACCYVAGNDTARGPSGQSPCRDRMATRHADRAKDTA